MKTVLKIFGGLFLVALVAVAAAVYFFGPSYGGALLGKPYFLFNASEKRINTAMVDTAAISGIYGESEEFQRAREAFKGTPRTLSSSMPPSTPPAVSIQKSLAPKRKRPPKAPSLRLTSTMASCALPCPPSAATMMAKPTPTLWHTA